MAQFLVANNAGSTLANSISNTATTANLQAGTGVLFPTPGPGQYFVGTLTSANDPTLQEIVHVTNITGDTITMVRAQEGTTAENWSANDLFDNLITAGTIQALVQDFQAQDQSFNGAVDTGSANAYLAGFTPAISTAPPPFTPFRVLIANSNTGASTANFGWGLVTIIRRDGSALIGNELIGGEVSQFVFDGTYLQWQGSAPATSAAITAASDTQSYVTPAQLANASFVFSGALVWAATLATPAGWLLSVGQAVSRTTYASLFAAITRSATVTLGIASPGVVNWTSHGLVAGSPVSFETTGTIPTGLSIATNYYVVSPSTNSFNVAATPGGSAIAFTGSQSGTQTCRFNPFGCGDGLTTFNVPDGRGATLAGWDAMGGTAKNLLGGNTSANGFVTAAMGNEAGEQSHTPIIAETAAHTHTYEHAPSNSGASGGGTPTGNASDNTGSTGGGSNFNVTQPTLLVNLFVKI